ncbi:unnamed protein product [Arctia plantaginis]|uniref:Uncharacterized protein n=1 Tax=Arctia plantaginis TaxID=874455 RepID=A0A8S1BMZ2_ARCPL|nr:unnamed protein product [Arctia plantaginis]
MATTKKPLISRQINEKVRKRRRPREREKENPRAQNRDPRQNCCHSPKKQKKSLDGSQGRAAGDAVNEKRGPGGVPGPSVVVLSAVGGTRVFPWGPPGSIRALAALGPGPGVSGPKRAAWGPPPGPPPGPGPAGLPGKSRDGVFQQNVGNSVSCHKMNIFFKQRY